LIISINKIKFPKNISYQEFCVSVVADRPCIVVVVVFPSLDSIVSN